MTRDSADELILSSAVVRNGRFSVRSHSSRLLVPLDRVKSNLNEMDHAKHMEQAEQLYGDIVQELQETDISVKVSKRDFSYSTFIIGRILISLSAHR